MRSFACVMLIAWMGGTFVPVAAAQESSVERITVHGASLDGNLEGDSPNRDVSVYLPPSYRTDTDRRYPVVYMLHGFTDDDAKWMGFRKHFINLPETIDQALEEGMAREMIVVVPNAFTRFWGSMYSTSVTVGDWETFIARELVAYIDAHYRTIPDAASRGLAGHSMGGYGAIRLGMKYPDVFSSIYMLSASAMTPRTYEDNPVAREAETVTSVDDIEGQSFMVLASLARAAAWAPDPINPPFYLDLPTKDGEVQPEVVARLAANATLVMIHQYIPNLKRLNAIAFDVGTGDTGNIDAARELDQVLNDYGITHTFETYEGGHVDHIAERVRTRALPFFAKHLAFE